MIKKIIDYISVLLHKGFFHIAGSNVINRLVSAVTNIMIARYLGKHNYGVFGAAFNIYTIFVIFSGLGMYNAILVFCSENREDNEKTSFYRYGLTSGFLATIFLSSGMLIYANCAKLGIPESKDFICMLSGLPLADYIMRYLLVILRTQKENKKYALYTNISTISYFIFGCLGACFFGISGTIIGRYISYTIVIIIAFFRTYKYLFAKLSNDFTLGKNKIKELWNYSLKNGASSALNQILYLIDVFLISNLIKNAEVVASYKVAVLIPEGLAFIPTSIMVFLVPVIAEHNNDSRWLIKNTKKLFFFTGVLNIIISFVLIVLAPYIIRLLWGIEYLDSVPCFRLLCVNYFVMGTFRLSCTNILAVLHKVNFNLILGVISGALDIVLDYCLINKYGAIGAAWATVITVVFISIFSVPYLVLTLDRMKKGELERMKYNEKKL